MKLFGNLKEKVDNAQTKEESREAIKKAGMLLNDDALEAVSGGQTIIDPFASFESICSKNGGGPHEWSVIRGGLYMCSICKKICKDKKSM